MKSLTGRSADGETAERPKQVLICSGLDPAGGAGFIADCRVVTACGARPIGVVTAHTVQNSQGVTAAQPVDDALIASQLRSVLSDTNVDAIKIGMLGNAAIATALVDVLLDVNDDAPIVWDPVMHPTRGGVALYDGDIDQLFRLFSQLATRRQVVITPNTIELARLCDRSMEDHAGLLLAAATLANTSRMTLLVKGGHSITRGLSPFFKACAFEFNLFSGEATEFTPPRAGAGPSGGETPIHCVDWLYQPDQAPVALRADYIMTATGGIHGTGCALATALATYLACGEDLPAACLAAKHWVHARMLAAVTYGRGAASVV